MIQPADLSLSATDNDCVELTRGAEIEATWCATGITSFDAELPYVNADEQYGLLVVVNGRLLPSAEYVIWDEVGTFALVASSHTSTSLRGLTYLVQSEGKTLRCNGEAKTLQCTPDTP